MSFSELNSVEHYIIHQMSGINLNNENVFEIFSIVYPRFKNDSFDLFKTQLYDILGKKMKEE